MTENCRFYSIIFDKLLLVSNSVLYMYSTNCSPSTEDLECRVEGGVSAARLELVAQTDLHAGEGWAEVVGMGGDVSGGIRGTEPGGGEGPGTGVGREGQLQSLM